jgi:YD repeat-containing protein
MMRGSGRAVWFYFALLMLICATRLVQAQELRYQYDKAGNLISIGRLDTSNDPFNCGTFAKTCDGGAGQCQNSTCVVMQPAQPPSPPPPFEGVLCYVFNDGFTNVVGPSDAIFISGRTANNEQGKACVPGGEFGVCRRWFGRCKTTTTNEPVHFQIFDDGTSNVVGPADAIYIPKNGNHACIPDGTATGTCRRWFGLPATQDKRAADCSIFTDGYGHPRKSEAFFIPSPIPSGGEACIPGGGSSGICNRWFGLCEVQAPPPWLSVPLDLLLQDLGSHQPWIDVPLNLLLQDSDSRPPLRKPKP